MPNRSKRRRSARMKAGKNTKPEIASNGESSNAAIEVVTTKDEPTEDEPCGSPTKKPNLNATTSEKSNEGKDSKAKRKLIFNGEEVVDEAILEKLEKAMKEVDEEESSCISIPDNDIGGTDPNPDLLAPQDISPDESRGVMKVLLKEGIGECPGYRDRVFIEYEGYIVEGRNKTLFDSTVNKENATFGLGRGEVIKGWDLAVATMKKQEKSYFFITPPYGFGEAGTSIVPPNSKLMYSIELVDWKLEDLTPKKDGSVLRKIRIKGEGSTSPKEGSMVKVKLCGQINENVIDNRIQEFLLGEGSLCDIPHGVELALYKFQLNEKSTIYLKDNKYEFETGQKETKIGPVDLTYDVTLLEFTKAKDIWEMNTDEKYARALWSKERGLFFFKKNNFKFALKYFEWILVCLEKEPGVEPASVESRNSLLLSGFLNISLCHLKLGNYKDVIKYCDKALEMNPQNEKALYRRGQAKMMINDCEDALKDFNTLQSLYPANKAANTLVVKCQQQINCQEKKDLRTYSKMFDKFVKQDQERMKNIKTETGVWQDDDGARPAPRPMTEAERLIEQNNSLLRDANIIELSNNVKGFKRF